MQTRVRRESDSPILPFLVSSQSKLVGGIPGIESLRFSNLKLLARLSGLSLISPVSIRSSVAAEEEVRTGGLEVRYQNPSLRAHWIARTTPGWQTAMARRMEAEVGGGVSGLARRRKRNGQRNACDGAQNQLATSKERKKTTHVTEKAARKMTSNPNHRTSRLPLRQLDFWRTTPRRRRIPPDLLRNRLPHRRPSDESRSVRVRRRGSVAPERGAREVLERDGVVIWRTGTSVPARGLGRVGRDGAGDVGAIGVRKEAVRGSRGRGAKVAASKFVVDRRAGMGVSDGEGVV